MRLFFFLVGLLLSFRACACSLGYLENEILFKTGAASISSEELRNTLDWHGKTRRAFPAGFEAYIVLWLDANAGIPASLMWERVRYARNLLEQLGVAKGDIKLGEIRTSYMEVESDDDERFFNTVRIVLAPRCPHACCDQ